jgi:UDPglucose 6-dehydrogenase
LTASFRVGIVRTGYVGLVTGTCLSHLGHQVVCIDRDEGRISVLKAARLAFYEPGHEELVSRSFEQQRLFFADPGSLVRLVGEAEVIFVAVDPPRGRRICRPLERRGHGPGHWLGLGAAGVSP